MELLMTDSKVNEAHVWLSLTQFWGHILIVHRRKLEVCLCPHLYPIWQS